MFWTTVLVIFCIYLLVRLNQVENKVDRLIEQKSAGSRGQSKEHVEQKRVTAPAEMRAEAAPAFATSEALVPAETTHTEPPATQEHHVKAPEDSNAEFAFGSKVFTGVGVVAVLLAVGFFLRYAFAHDLISPGARVGLGIVFGVALAGLGNFLRDKYKGYGLALVGGGLGVIYISLYAAHYFYGFLPAGVVMVAIVALTVGSVAMGIRYASELLVGYAFFGAYLMPLLLMHDVFTSVHAFFWYLIVVNAGVLLVARFNAWPRLTIESLIASSILICGWVAVADAAAVQALVITYISIVFFIYFATSTLNFVFRDRDYKGMDSFLMYAVPTVYFLLELSVVHTKDGIALLALAIGAFYLVMAAVLRSGFSTLGDLKMFSNGLLVIALPYFVLAAGLHFHGSAVTLAWATEAVAMLGIGTLVKTKTNRIAAIVLAVITGLQLLTVSWGHLAPLWNARVLTYLLVAVMFGIFWAVYQFVHATSSPSLDNEVSANDEPFYGRLIGAVGMFVTPLILIVLEFTDALPSHAWLDIPAAWAIYFVLALSLATMAREPILRVLSYIGITVGVCTMLMAQWTLDLSQHATVVNIRVATALLYVLAAAFAIFLLRTREDVDSEEKESLSTFLSVIVHGVLLWVFSVEIIDHYNYLMHTASGDPTTLENFKRIGLSAYWLVYALALLSIGIFYRSAIARKVASGLFAVVVFKIFLYDTANFSDIYRFVSFLILGIILLLAGYFYYRFKDRILQFVK